MTGLGMAAGSKQILDYETRKTTAFTLHTKNSDLSHSPNSSDFPFWAGNWQ